MGSLHAFLRAEARLIASVVGVPEISTAQAIGADTLEERAVT